MVARTERVVFRLTPDERRDLRALAGIDGEGAYIRSRIFLAGTGETEATTVTHPGVWRASYTVDGTPTTELVLAYYGRDSQIWLRGTDDDYDEPQRIAAFLDGVDDRRVVWLLVASDPRADGGA